MISLAGRTVWATVVLGVILASPPTRAEEVLSLGPGRGYNQPTFFESVMTGTSMEVVRSALEADGFSFTPAESFTAADLAGYRIVFLGLFDPAESLAGEEEEALDAFVRAGGALVYLGDNDLFETPNGAMTSLFGTVFGGDPAGTVAEIIPDPTHPIIDGRAGVVTVYDASGNKPGYFGGIADPGPYAHRVLATPQRTVVAAIERDALQPGSGPVVLIAEANGFMNDGVGTIHLGDNLVLMRNIFQFVKGPCTSDADCADGLFCNGVETCDALSGDCRPGAFPCSSPLGCFEDADLCAPCTADGQCADGVFCNGQETCDQPTGQCLPGAFPCSPPLGCQEDADVCGACADDSQCDDGLFCNGAETCAAGACVPAASPCDNGLFCDGAETCNESADDCGPGAPPCAAPTVCLEDLDLCGECGEDADCADGLFCNGVETCLGGFCQPGASPCDDGLFCNGLETCVEATHQCFAGVEPCALPLACFEEMSTCGACTADAQCADGVFCNGAETCDVPTGQCQAGVFPCAPPLGCQEAADVCGPCTDDAECDDGLFCNGVETCVAGACLVGASPCDDGQFCNGVETCDEATDQCGPGSPPCAAPLTCLENIDTCGVCASDADCDDGLYCTGVEHCAGGVCKAGPAPCDDGVFCNGAEVCVEAGQQCLPGAYPCALPLGCLEDVNTCGPCTADGQCNDGLFCNGAETCQAGGACVAGSPACDDGLFCDGIESCDESADQCGPGTPACTPPAICLEDLDLCGECASDPDCADGLFCNGVESCVNGFCQNGLSACDDGLFCNGAEICVEAAQQCLPGTPPCPPPQCCLEDQDACGPCSSDPQCDDGLFCNGLETCLGGSCVPGVPPCDDGLYCNGVETCAEDIDQCGPGAPPCIPADNCLEDEDVCGACTADIQCDDGLFCTGLEQCNLVDHQCVAGASPCPPELVCIEATAECVQCTNNAECDNGLFCDGPETCNLATHECQPGDFPCSLPLGCLEDADTCGACTADAQCADPLFCNGVEVCNPLSHECEPGDFPCPLPLGCLEDAATCGLCTTDAQCDNGLFCDGAEVCASGGQCQQLTAPCQDDCEQCDEASATCTWCTLDIDHNTVIGSGDFAFFSNCFGNCYAAEDPCAAADFDGDPAYCVGSGDFALLSGCFGSACAECAACAAPEPGPHLLRYQVPSVGAIVRLVALAAPSADAEADTLPNSLRSIQSGRTFYVEIWAARQPGAEHGLASAYVNVAFAASDLAVHEVIPSPQYQLLSRGELDGASAVVRSVGGCTEPGYNLVGLAPAWSKVATLRVYGLRAGSTTLNSSPAAYPLGLSVFAEPGVLGASMVDFGNASVRIAASTIVAPPVRPDDQALPPPVQVGPAAERVAPVRR